MGPSAERAVKLILRGARHLEKPGSADEPFLSVPPEDGSDANNRGFVLINPDTLVLHAHHLQCPFGVGHGGFLLGDNFLTFRVTEISDSPSAFKTRIQLC